MQVTWGPLCRSTRPTGLNIAVRLMLFLAFALDNSIGLESVPQICGK